MSDRTLGPGPRTRVRRLAKKAAYDEDVIFEILDAAPLCHVASLVNGRAVCLPTLHVREQRNLYLHGSPSNEVLRSLVRAGEAFVTATLYEGLRLARSGFESSIAYRSVVVLGRTRELEELEEKRRILELFVDRVAPGRGEEVRPMTEKEQRLTMVVEVAIEEASAKISTGPTDDDVDDQGLPIWAGTVPARLVFEPPIADNNGAMALGNLEVPASVRRLLDRER